MATPRKFNRARMTTATTGTGTITLGSAVTKYQTYAAAGVTNGLVTRNVFEDGNAWEISSGTYTSAGTTLTRTLISSSTGSLLSLSGTAEVFIDATAEDFNQDGQIPGTATNDNASAGNLGEYLDTSTGNSNANATVTMTIASPAVVTWTGHGFTVGAATTAIKFTTTGALPTGITSGTTYYLKAVNANTFNIATTADNALAGTFITTTGSQSGTHTGDVRVSMTATVQQNVAAISLGAGDWDVGGQMLKAAGATTTVTFIGGNLSLVSAAVDRTFGRRLSFQYSNNTFVPSNTEFTVFDFAPARFSLSATTTIYLVADDQFATSTMVSSGWLRARRVR